MPRELPPVLELRPYRLRLREPLRSSLGVVEFRQGFLVLARDGDLIGRGEADERVGGLREVERGLERIARARAEAGIEAVGER